MSARKVITVDGLSGSGKTTLSRLLAEKLGYVFFSSGSLYRSLGWLALKNNVALNDASSLCLLLERHQVRIERNKNSSDSYISVAQQNVEALIRSPEVSEATSIISTISEVRAALIDRQRNAFLDQPDVLGIVAEGRDMGTVIFPEADLKFFITLDEEVRIERRIKQLLGQNASESEQNKIRLQMHKEIKERDKRDQTRLIAPAIAAQDAISIDNGRGTLTEIVEIMYSYALQKLGDSGSMGR